MAAMNGMVLGMLQTLEAVGSCSTFIANSYFQLSFPLSAHNAANLFPHDVIFPLSQEDAQDSLFLFVFNNMPDTFYINNFGIITD